MESGLTSQIWSCAIILYAMTCGTLPFEDPNHKKLKEKITKLDYKIPHHLSSELKDLMKLMLKIKPEERAKINDI